MQNSEVQLVLRSVDWANINDAWLWPQVLGVGLRSTGEGR